jgi:hypothetical protein
MKEKKGRFRKIIALILYLTVIGFTIIVLYPIINVFSISLRPADRLLSTSLKIIPDGASFHAYKSYLPRHLSYFGFGTPFSYHSQLQQQAWFLLQRQGTPLAGSTFMEKRVPWSDFL